MKIIKIKEDIRIRQGLEDIILEEGDSIRIINEHIIRYEGQKLEVLVNKPNWTDEQIIEVLDEIMNNYDSLNYSLGKYKFRYNQRDIEVALIPKERRGTIEFHYIKIL